MKRLLQISLTALLVVAAAWFAWREYRDYLTHPWTRDGQVRADVVQITPRVSGPIVKLAVIDNQSVKAGDLLFNIDPRTFEATLEQARAQYDKTRDTFEAQRQQVEAATAQVEAARASVRQAESGIKELDSQIEKNKAEYDRQLEMLPKRATSQKAVDRAKANFEVSVEKHRGAYASRAQAQAALNQAEAQLAETRANLGALDDANASIRLAQAQVREAELNLEFTEVRAPVDGYVTNLNLRLGSQAVANQPVVALVDVSSFWVSGFFRETLIRDIARGDEAIVTLMGYQDTPLKGTVDSLGWGIAQQDGSTGFELLPNVSPTFEWIRLAQRIPVRVQLDAVPEEVKLRVGMTASVLVRSGSADTPGAQSSRR